MNPSGDPTPTVPEDGVDGAEDETQPASRKRKRFGLLQEIALIAVAALVLALGMKAFVAEAFYIPSESMEPGLVTNDRILVQKPSYWGSGEPERGDVVVFKDPGGWLSASDKPQGNPLTDLMTVVGLFPEEGHLVKRVIGVAGDVIECCDEEGRLIVNGVAQDESSFARPAETACGTSEPGTCYGPMPQTETWKVGPIPEGMIFVLGDNRNNSGDSSAQMCTELETECTRVPWVPVDNVAGKVAAVMWPLSRFEIIKRPDSFEQAGK